MKKTKFTEEQIIKILSESDQGKTVEEICRANKISNFTFYNWRRKFKGLQVQDARKLKDLESENVKLKKLVANLSLDNLVLKDALGKK